MRAFAEWLAGTSLSNTIQSIGWLIPWLQSIHILMIGVVFVSVLMIALRVLGLVRVDQPFEDVLGRFAPWMRGGMAVMVVTGVILTIGEPVRELFSFSFRLKMALLVIGVGSVIAFQRLVTPAAAGAQSGAQGGAASEFSGAAKAGAVAMVALWLFIIFLGRAIAYDVEVWGPLSPMAAG